MSKKIKARFGDETVTRSTSAAYTHASRTPAGRIRFHTSESAARSAAGRYGRVVEVEGAAPAKRTCVVCEGHGSYEVGPSAVDGTFITVPCHRCSTRTEGC